MIKEELEEESIEYLLNKLLNLSKKELQEGHLSFLINQLLLFEEYAIYSMIKLLTLKYRRIGILKGYTISELQPFFKWERTQLNYYLKKATKQNVLFYNK
ncbi:MAG TPA: hypothetical protein VMX55_13840 [candidate division Zixibacteria bacterium]|nr:hypothetical protein [candidate division Zixibacteria bacterium]